MKKKFLLCAGIVLAFLVLAYGFVPQVLSGMIVNQSDISGWQGMAHEMMDWNAAHPDDQTAWTGSMFSGMPTTTIHASTKGDWTQTIYDVLLTGKRPATYLFISLLGAFLLMLAFGVHPLIAAGGAVAMTFCSYNMQIIQVGHNTKMQALAFLPWVLAALIFTYRSALGAYRAGTDKAASQPNGDIKQASSVASAAKQAASGANPNFWLPFTALGAALFGLCLSFQVKANHPQISYYLALMILFYVIALVVRLIISKQFKALAGRFLAASALLLVLGLAGIGTNAIKLLPTMEYTPYSMRGGASNASEKGAAKGLDLDYATAWSYGWEELPNLLIPNYNGGSSSGAVNPKHSETYDLLKRAGQPNLKEICKALPLYWGPQPFTAGPMYMGAITIFLFILALCFYKGRERWWLIAVSILAVLLALGSHFLWFTKLFYDYVPLYNKFRTVSMALVILQFTLPVLGFLMLDNIVKSSESSATLRRQVLIAGGISAGICLVLALMQSLTGTFSGSVDEGQQDILVDALSADRRHLLWVDTWRSILLIAAAAGLLFWGVSADGNGSSQTSKRLSNKSLAACLVCVLCLVDLFAVGKRYLNADHFISPRGFQSQFNKRPVDEMILADQDPSYRVLDLTVNVFNDSHPSYWHKNIGGYSPAKLQRYQEYIDAKLAPEINTLYRAIGKAATVQEAEDALPYLESLASLNCRYIIVGAENPPLRYSYARGNAWFCNQTEDGTQDSITLSSYAPNKLVYDYSSARGGMAVFSEVYYPVGWKARLEDGCELEISLYEGSEGIAAGLLRCIELPAGTHQLSMSFEPESYRRGEGISRACSIALILIVILSAAAPLATAGRRKRA